MPLTTFLVKKEFLLPRPVLIFQPTVNSGHAIIKASCVKILLVSWEKCAVTKCLHIYISICSGGGTFWLRYENLTFKGPEAQQATAVNRIEVNKIPPNFNTLCDPFMGRLVSLKGSLRDTFMGRSASKG